MDRLLTVRQVADVLGGERYVRRLIEERRIEYVKDRRRVFISETVVKEFIAARTVAPRREPRGRYRRAA
ncbi:excisionase family DNA-binding protein [Streptomyces sp. NBC_01614]|uniref:Helix-turn-helix domain-containing protein n=1 Tax=Streptomyces sp. NBC_00180 TaxID=2903632 RepID=A0AAU1I0D9_9ACTN